MTALSNKIDFVAIISVDHANPNGDPLNGNCPREDYDGYGLISDVCIKRKLRNRFQDMGQKIFVQMEERTDDDCSSLKQRAEQCPGLYTEETQESASSKKSAKSKAKKKVFNKNVACSTWFDVRAFGQVFAFKNDSKSNDGDQEGAAQNSTGISEPVRGPVSIRIAKSVSVIRNHDMQITKSVAGESESDTMGTKHFVDFAVYVVKGTINCQLAELTGFSDEDAEIFHEALKTLFENDASSARPEGSMEVCRVYWWKHDCKIPKVTSAQIHRSVEVVPLDKTADCPRSLKDYKIQFKNPEGCVEPDVFKSVDMKEE